MLFRKCAGQVRVVRRGWVLFDVTQFDAGRSGEIRVEPKHVDRELDFVHYALAGTVPARKEFEVFDRVVLAIAVAMVNCFLFAQTTAQMLFHYVAVFKNILARRFSVLCWNSKADVSPTAYRASDFRVAVSLSVKLTYPFVFALLAAQFLLSVYATALVAMARGFFAAIRARKFVARFGILAAPGVRTRHGAVQRISAEFLLICRHVGLHHREGLLAFFAGEFDRRSSCRRLSIFAVIAATCETAVFASRFNLVWVAVERLLTAFARTFNWHGQTPLFGDKGKYGRAGWTCQVAY